ncbi:hypothetical protein TRFO_19744 [Tritrichomonas foetus]|uniref:Peptidase S8/S53 domain-containing protein n=1 Tax=Tritrichomonas foetus TaxID=1144522 RepID=A0A1J4KIG5_9EUKA|nr:hypothetical protein TRFO_19744 [Tritrichomonas foetus]|eukprot:OHT10850.1 hypothetical protein TRFO_19744 [Tritrichomonas foetus]
MLILFLISFHSIDDLFIDENIQEKAQLLEEITSEGWYYIYCKNKSFLQDLNLSLKTSNFVTNKWICAFLTGNKVEKISSNSSFKLIPASEKDGSQLLSSGGEVNYLIESNDFYIPPNSHHYYDNFYISKEYPNKNTHYIRSVTILPDAKVLNRWSKGVVQAEEFQLHYENKNRLVPIQPFYEKGIQGQKEIVSIVDSGVDHRHCFFHDSKVKVPINMTNLNHRKIVRYEAIADAYDGNNGHGTHVSGVIAGKSFCEQCSASLYNGIAPEAKLFFVDAGYESNPTVLTPDYSFKAVLQIALKLNSSIFSNSWGFPPTTKKVRSLFDRIGYETPSVSFFFGAGNTRKRFKIFTPANSKNVIAVGSIGIPQLKNLDNGYHDLYFLYSETKNSTQKIINLPFSKSFLSFMTDVKKLLTFQQKKIVRFYTNATNYENNFVYISEGSFNYCNSIRTLYRKNGSAVFIKEDLVNQLYETCNPITNIPVFSVTSLDYDEIVTINVNFTYNGLNDVLGDVNSIGPTNFGLLKPEILAPGDDSVSAKGTQSKAIVSECTLLGLVSKSGTSMATPAAAGAATLLNQYFKDGFYPSCKKNPKDSLFLRSPTIKALLINSASRITSHNVVQPTLESGFGSIHLANSLILDENSPHFGLRIIDYKEISSSDHIYTTISIPQREKEFKGKENLLTITLCWLDPPLDSKSLIPIFADLDLIVITPNKTILYGNMCEYEESHATVERTIIENPIHGEYQIQIRCPKLSIPEKVHFSLAINGPFDHHNTKMNPVKLPFKKVPKCYPVCGTDCNQKSDKCYCPPDKTGIHCASPVTQLRLKDTTIKLKSRTPTFVRFEFPKLKESQALKIHILLTNGSLCHLTIGQNQIPKFGGKFINFISLKTTNDFIFDPRENEKYTAGSFIYMEFYEASQRNPDLVLTLEIFSPNQVMENNSASPKAKATQKNSSTNLLARKSFLSYLGTIFMFGLLAFILFIQFVFIKKQCFAPMKPRIQNEEKVPFL